MKTLKKPCVICGRWYTPDPRARNRQRACGEEACRLKQRQVTQRSWRERNPSYFSERRLRTRVEQLAEPVQSSRLSLPPALHAIRSPVLALKRVPWDYVREVFGAAGETLLAYLLAQVLRAAKAERRIEVIEIPDEYERTPGHFQAAQFECQDETWGQAIEKSSEIDTLQGDFPNHPTHGQDERVI